MKGSAFHGIGIGKPRLGKMAKKHERRQCKGCKQKDKCFWLYNSAECTYDNANLTPVCQKDGGSKKSPSAQSLEVQYTLWRRLFNIVSR